MSDTDLSHEEKQGMRRTRLTVVCAKLEACLVYREAHIQVHGKRGRMYFEVHERSQMHQSDVPECAAAALAADCVKFKTSRGGRS
jgi:uncharacterized protein with ACT and thioredoxin-like domain